MARRIITHFASWNNTAAKTCCLSLSWAAIIWQNTHHLESSFLRKYNQPTHWHKHVWFWYSISNLFYCSTHCMLGLYFDFLGVAYANTWNTNNNICYDEPKSATQYLHIKYLNCNSLMKVDIFSLSYKRSKIFFYFLEKIGTDFPIILAICTRN